MKKGIMVLALIMLAACFINKAEVEYCLSTVIRVYGPGEFAVKGPVEEQAQAFIKAWTKKPSRILLEGSADKKGDVAFNDKIGKWRADEMKAFMEAKFPDANIIARSLGDQFDVRQVQISVEFEEAETTPQMSEQEVKKIIGEVKDGLIAQKALINKTAGLLDAAKADIEAAKVLAPVAQPEVPTSLFWQLVVPIMILVVPCVVAAMIIAVLFHFLMRRRTKANATTEPAKFKLWHQSVGLTVKGTKYKFFPEITEDGDFVALHQINGRPMLIKSQDDLEKSIVWSLKRNRSLIAKLLESGRLVECK